MFLLYNKDGTIPDKHKTNFYKKLSSVIIDKTATITFENLPNGLYAVNIIHDENTNGKIDTGFILPNEGIGFSKLNTLNIGNRPNFSKTSFQLQTDLNIAIKTIYM